MVISLQLLRGDLEQVRRDHPLLSCRGVATTRKLGFPEVIMPGEVGARGGLGGSHRLERG